MKLSILIPVYNVENFIGNCIDSIIAQNISINDYEIIVINDGSTDNSKKIINEYVKNYSNIYLYNQKNCGVGYSRNRAISYAKGAYIYFIDPDDYLAKDVLKSILLMVNKYDTDILTFSTTITKKVNLTEPETKILNDYTLKVFNGYDYLSEFGFRNEVWWYIIKRSYLEELGIELVEGRWLEDAIFTATLILKSNRIAHLPIDAHRYVKRENSIMATQTKENKIKMMYDMKNVVLEYNVFISDTVFSNKEVNKQLISRLRSKQQSFVFFMMIRMLTSTIKFKDAKFILKEVTKVNAYPLNHFLGKDYNGFLYSVLTALFNKLSVYFALFIVINPIFKFKHAIINLLRINKK